MKKIVLFALIAAVSAGALLYFYLAKLETQKQVNMEYDNVVVAVGDIPAYTPITSEMVKMKQIPLGYAHPLAAHTLEEVVGYVTESEIIEGEEVLPAKLKQFGESDSGLSYVVPEGMRAITVSVDEISGVAGFLQRGDYVDVLAFTTLTIYGNAVKEAYRAKVGTAPSEEIDESIESATVVVAQNICVGAIGTSFTNNATETEGIYTSITLLVTPEDAMRILQSSQSGVLTLVLRASGDHERNTEEPLLSNQLLEQAK